MLIDRSLDDPEVYSVALTTEEEGIGLLAGAHLGVGAGCCSCSRAGSATASISCPWSGAGQFPFLMLVSMRGDFGEGNPGKCRWAAPSSRARSDGRDVRSGRRCARSRSHGPRRRDHGVQAGQAVAVLLTQKLIGAKPF